eukprot:scaffold1484_cov241-Pinguiococcus_pyrenoidosus.AAC.11
MGKDPRNDCVPEFASRNKKAGGVRTQGSKLGRVERNCRPPSDRPNIRHNPERSDIVDDGELYVVARQTLLSFKRDSGSRLLKRRTYADDRSPGRDAFHEHAFEAAPESLQISRPGQFQYEALASSMCYERRIHASDLQVVAHTHCGHEVESLVVDGYIQVTVVAVPEVAPDVCAAVDEESSFDKDGVASRRRESRGSDPQDMQIVDIPECRTHGADALVPRYQSERHRTRLCPTAPSELWIEIHASDADQRASRSWSERRHHVRDCCFGRVLVPRHRCALEIHAIAAHGHGNHACGRRGRRRASCVSAVFFYAACQGDDPSSKGSARRADVGDERVFVESEAARDRTDHDAINYDAQRRPSWHRGRWRYAPDEVARRLLCFRGLLSEHAAQVRVDGRVGVQPNIDLRPTGDGPPGRRRGQDVEGFQNGQRHRLLAEGAPVVADGNAKHSCTRKAERR